jgi:oxygen-independent coproporphyrinogen-3 oxidase
VNEAAEITIEANPGTLDTAYLAAVRGLGVNRLSLGAQSMNNRELDLLGRIHKAAEVQEAVHCARSAGFENLNLDLIYGLPGQGLSGWQRTLDEAIAMKPEHLSLYALTLDAETPMWRAIKEMSLPDIDPDLSADQYEMAEDLLAAHGYRHYEISNWAEEGRECRHNMVYWQNRPYLGVGVAAHSWLDGHRMANTGNLDEYLAAFAGKRPLLPDMDEVIGLDLELAETVILGLRLEAGVDINSLKNRFGIDVLSYYSQPIREMVDSGLMKHTGEYIRLTRRGRLLSNEVFWRILPGN